MAIVNITVTNDEDFHCVFQYKSKTGDDDSVPIDMTGASLEMMLRRRAEDAAVLLRLGTDTGEIAFINISTGLFSVFISQDILVRLGLGDFDHSNIMTRGGLKTKLWSGILTNNAGPTR